METSLESLHDGTSNANRRGTSNNSLTVDDMASISSSVLSVVEGPRSLLPGLPVGVWARLADAY